LLLVALPLIIIRYHPDKTRDDPLATENFQRSASSYQLLQRKLSGDLGGFTSDSDEDYEDSDPGNDYEDKKGDHLGCGQGATGALFYLVKYLIKAPQ